MKGSYNAFCTLGSCVCSQIRHLQFITIVRYVHAATDKKFCLKCFCKFSAPERRCIQHRVDVIFVKRWALSSNLDESLSSNSLSVASQSNTKKRARKARGSEGGGSERAESLSFPLLAQLARVALGARSLARSLLRPILDSFVYLGRRRFAPSVSSSEYLRNAAVAPTTIQYIPDRRTRTHFSLKPYFGILLRVQALQIVLGGSSLA